MESRMLGNLHVRFGERDYGNLLPIGSKAPCPYSTRELIKSFWTFKHKKRPGRPAINQEIRQLILSMKNDNLYWGNRKIQGELLKLGFKIDEKTIQQSLLYVTL
jgi:hypothetical protein